jgi:hypothetical protein
MSIRLTELNVPAGPFIEGRRMTTAGLVFLIPNGEMNSTTIQKVASQESLRLEEKKIGFRVLNRAGRPHWEVARSEGGDLRLLLEHSFLRCEDNIRKKAALEVGFPGERRVLLLPTEGAELGR